MNPASNSCPFCNTLLPSGPISHCPRCGELLPGRRSDFSLPGNGPVPPPGPSSNSRLAWILLACMAAMAGAGLILALETWPVRQGRHPRPPREIYSPRSYSPIHLPALGFLPPDCRVIAGIHLVDLLKHPRTEKLFHGPRPGFLAKGLAGVERWTGLKIDALDHVVFGVTAAGNIPQLTVVVQTRGPYSLEDLGKVYAARPFLHHRKPLFRFNLEPAGGGYLWCADERTMVLLLRPDAVKIEDMDRIPALPRAGEEVVPQPLIEILEGRLHASVLWLAGKLDPPGSLGDLLAWFTFPPGLERPWKSLQRFGMGMLLQDDLTLMEVYESRDAVAAMALQEHLQKKRIPGTKSLKVVGPIPPGQELRATAILLACATSPAPLAAPAGYYFYRNLSLYVPPVPNPDGNWVTVQRRVQPEAIRSLLDTSPQPSKLPH